jgi:hypothetical protein
MNYTSSNGPRRFRGMFVLFFFAAAFGLSALVMWLWNAILPQVTGATTITYWQAMGLLVLARILFGGFHFRKPYSKRPPFAQKNFREKWMNLSSEEREKMKEEWRRRCSR